MSRERVITRTVKVVNYEVMVVNMETLKAEFVNVSLPSGDTMKEKQRDELIKSNLPSNLQFVNVSASSVTEKLYGMSEMDFLKYAKELPPR